MYVVSAGKDILRFASSGTAFALSASVASNVLFMSSTYHLLLSVSVGKTRLAFLIASTPSPIYSTLNSFANSLTPFQRSTVQMCLTV